MKKFIFLAVILTIIFFFFFKIVERSSIIKATSLMNAMGIKNNNHYRLYCEEKFDSITLMAVVVDFYNRKILLNGKLHFMKKNPKTNLFYSSSYATNTIFLKEYVDYNAFPAVPVLLTFTYSKNKNEYFISSMNAVTMEKRWEHKLNCSY